MAKSNLSSRALDINEQEIIDAVEECCIAANIDDELRLMARIISCAY